LKEKKQEALKKEEGCAGERLKNLPLHGRTSVLEKKKR